ncbi:MAG: nucleotidyltransferase family protein [Sphingomonadales bacterium]|nr:nucleotidyltransferase family protein [Sphingomonadales bacterium]MDE2568088.1 nucleotidyltransferase family protein [Sphingomonadales bacterium]
MSRPLASDVAMVLSAGLGKRMRPLTASRPKPLVRVAGRTLIDHSLDKLDEAGVARAVVNVHYLPDAMRAHLSQRKSPQVAISDETEKLLETGGGMVKALPLLGADPFFCLNSDNVWLDGPQNVFAQLSAAWDADRMDALLLVVPHPRAFNYRGLGDFHMDAEGRLTRRQSRKVAPFIYMGVQLVSYRLLRDAPEGAFGTMQLWERAIAEGRLHGTAFNGLWYEVGTPAMIAPTEAALTTHD